LTRRGFVAGLSATAGATIVGPLGAMSVYAQSAGPQRIVRRQTPLAAECDLSSLTGWATPNQAFPVLTSFADPLPAIEPGQWRLAVEGQVDQPVMLDYAALRAFPARTVAAVIECAGNSRNAVSPPFARSILGNGFVGNAEWRGAPLAAVLAGAGIKATAREIVLEGADRSRVAAAPADAAFAKSVPVDKALHPDTLLAYEMNGAPLPRELGGPVRIIVPGWYGTYHVKWVSRIEAIDRVFDGVFMTRQWRVRRRRDGFLRDEATSQIAVKSLIFGPAGGAQLTQGPQRIWGAAWSGGRDIASVQVSTDGGQSWRLAELGEGHGAYAWRLWELTWRPAAPGRATLLARATDTAGTSQPFAYDLDLQGFEVNHVQSVAVEIA
jgi:DMSO/TMAO reductase YedYZ molybdopterin-dependent catalytic subunit